MQEALARGEPAVLVPEKGPPRWFRLQTGDAGTGIDPRDGSFLFHTFWLSLLELMPDPQLDRYRFRAEIRQQEDPARLGEVGIYFAHANLVGTKGAADSFLALSFTDGPQSLNVVKDAKGQVFRRATLEYRFIREPGVGLGFNGRALITSPGKAAVKFYEPPGPGETSRPWRSLAVEVTPEEVRVFWENQLIAVMPRPDLEACANESLRNTAEAKELTFRFNPRGALGLYLLSGAAFFRNVVIEPLPE
jgi:hypothetical protein